MTQRMFPVLGHSDSKGPVCPKEVPWEFVAPHAAQAKKNHYQTLEQLAGRGGLSPTELVALVDDEDVRPMTGTMGITKLKQRLTAWEAKKAFVLPLSPQELSLLNPGIRNAVAWLRARGFNTCDSGDGSTHEHDCDLAEPYVHMLLDQEKAFAETDRLGELLKKVNPEAEWMVAMGYAPGEPTTVSIFGYALLELKEIS